MSTQSSKNYPTSASIQAHEPAYVEPVQQDGETADMMEAYVKEHHQLFDSGINNPARIHRQEKDKKQTESPEIISVQATSAKDQEHLDSRPHSPFSLTRWTKWLLVALLGVLILVIVIAILAAKDVIGDDDNSNDADKNHGGTTYPEHNNADNLGWQEDEDPFWNEEEAPPPFWIAMIQWQAIGTFYPENDISYWTNFMDYDSTVEIHPEAYSDAMVIDGQLIQYSYTVAESTRDQPGPLFLDVSFQSGCCSVNWSKVRPRYTYPYMNGYAWGAWSSIETCECNGLKLKHQIRATCIVY